MEHTLDTTTNVAAAHAKMLEDRIVSLGKTPLYVTRHGSRLYGLSNPNSDYDYYCVVSEKVRAKQVMFGEFDVTTVGYSTFLDYCAKGSPQALEAMFSDHAEFDNMPFDRRLYYHPGMTNVRHTYFRTIKAFWHEGQEQNNFKMKRHAMRLTLNLRELHERGRFNPTLTPAQAAWCDMHARLPVLTEAL